MFPAGEMTIVGVVLLLVSVEHTVADEILCLSCKNSPSPSHCNQVARCGAYDRCYMELYVNTLGAVRYDFGCRDEHICHHSTTKRQAGHIHVCTHCCNTTMCNFAGCGNNNLPAQHTRGPLCFACDGHNKVDDCAQFKQCNRGEVCVLEQKTIQLTGADTYSSNCMQAATCENIYQKLNGIFPMVGKRRRSYVHSIELARKCLIECCDVDFCNRGCGITPQNMTLLYTSLPPNVRPATSTTTATSQPRLTTRPTVPTTKSPFFFTMKTTTKVTPAVTTNLPNMFTTARMTTSGYAYSQSSGCFDDLPNWYCQSNDVLSSLCHLKDLAPKCRKSCHLCRTYP